MTGGDTWVGVRLVALRAKKKLTQEELAERAGIARETLNKIEKGKRKMSAYYAAKIAPVLEVKPAELQPPTAPGPSPEDPYVLLVRLAETADYHQEQIDGLTTEIEALKRAASRRRRATGGA